MVLKLKSFSSFLGYTRQGYYQTIPTSIYTLLLILCCWSGSVHTCLFYAWAHFDDSIGLKSLSLNKRFFFHFYWMLKLKYLSWIMIN